MTERTNRTAFDVYDLHLRLQAELSFGAELPFFKGFAPWADMTSVVDLGCGNGAFLVRLANAFPDMSFIGVDIREDAIEAARRDHSAPNVTYLAGTVDQIEHRVDALISRFCLLYVTDLPGIVGWAADHVDGAVLQIDNDDSALHFPPSLTRFESVLHVTRARIRDGRSRTAANTTAPAWQEVGFDLTWSAPQVITSEPPFSRDRLYPWLVTTAELSLGAPLDPRLAEDLFRWWADGDYFQYGMRASWFQRS